MLVAPRPTGPAQPVRDAVCGRDDQAGKQAGDLVAGQRDLTGRAGVSGAFGGCGDGQEGAGSTSGRCLLPANQDHTATAQHCSDLRPKAASILQHHDLRLEYQRKQGPLSGCARPLACVNLARAQLTFARLTSASRAGADLMTTALAKVSLASAIHPSSACEGASCYRRSNLCRGTMAVKLQVRRLVRTLSVPVRGVSRFASLVTCHNGVVRVTAKGGASCSLGRQATAGGWAARTALAAGAFPS